MTFTPKLDKVVTEPTATADFVPKLGKVVTEDATAERPKGIMSFLGSLVSRPTLGMEIITGLGKKIVRTGVSGAETLEKVTGQKAIGVDEQFKEKIQSKTTGEKIGYGLGEVIEFLAPIPGAGKVKIGFEAIKATTHLGRGAKLLGKVGIEASEQLGRTAISSGDIERAKMEAGIAGAIPIVGATAKVFKLSSIGEVFTGVAKQKWQKWSQLAKESPEKVQQLRQFVSEEPTKPMLGLAKRIVGRLQEMKTQAQEAYKLAADTWRQTAGEQTFDFTKRLDQLNEPLGEFGLKVERVRDPATGAITADIALGAKGKIMPFSKEEQEAVSKLLDEIKNAKALSPDDVPLLLDKFDETYDAIPLNPDGTAKKSHALIMKLKRSFDDQIQETLPTELKNARRMYRDYYETYDDVGSKVMNKAGEVRDTAESFLGNLSGLNKGAVQERITRASQKLGFDVTNAAADLKLAQEMIQTVPQTTKNRTMDIIRGLVTGKMFYAVGGGAVATGNIPALIGTVLFNVLSSPQAFSGIIETVAGVSKKLPIAEAIKKIPKEEIEAIRRLLIHQITPSTEE